MKFFLTRLPVKKMVSLPVLPLVVAPLILLGPVLFTGQALFWGTPALQFLPWRLVALEQIQSGIFPLWNPLNGMGAPLLANYQSGYLYPPNWFYFLVGMVFGPPGMGWGMGVLVVFHWILAGLGMASLTRKLGFRPISQVISGLAYGLSGYLVARAGFLSINAATAWLPWIFGAGLTLAGPGGQPARARISGWLQLVLCTGMLLLAGHAQTAWYSLVFVSAWFIYWTWPGIMEWVNSWRDSRLFLDWGIKWTLFGSALVVGVGIAAAQLLPTYELLQATQRAAGVDTEFVMNYSFWPWRFFTLLAPNMFGNPSQGNYWGYGNYWEDAVYIGLLPLILAISSAFRKTPATNLRRMRWFLWASTFAAFILALGKNTEIFPWLYANVPTFNMFQAPTRINLITVFSLSLLGGMGMEAWENSPHGKAKRWIMRGLVAGLGVLAGSVVLRLVLSGRERTFAEAFLSMAVFVVISSLLALNRARLRSLGAWQAAVILLVMVDLIAAGWGLNPGVPASFYQPVQPLPAAGRVFMPLQDEEVLRYQDFFTFNTYEMSEDALRKTMLTNLNVVDGTASVNNFDPLLIARYQRWMEHLAALDEEEIQPWLDAMNVGLVVRRNPPSESGLPVNLESPVTQERIKPAGRLGWYPCAIVAVNDAVAWEIYTRYAARSNGLVIENASGEAGLPNVCDGNQPSADSVTTRTIRLVEDRPNRITIQLNPGPPGWLLLKDSWYPGWKVSIDGAPAEIYPGNTLFRAVPVHSAARLVVFEYQPAAFTIGLQISAASVFLVGIVAGFSRRKWRF